MSAQRGKFICSVDCTREGSLLLFSAMDSLLGRNVLYFHTGTLTHLSKSEWFRAKVADNAQELIPLFADCLYTKCCISRNCWARQIALSLWDIFFLSAVLPTMQKMRHWGSDPPEPKYPDLLKYTYKDRNEQEVTFTHGHKELTIYTALRMSLFQSFLDRLKCDHVAGFWACKTCELQPCQGKGLKNMCAVAKAFEIWGKAIRGLVSSLSMGALPLRYECGSPESRLREVYANSQVEKLITRFDQAGVVIAAVAWMLKSFMGNVYMCHCNCPVDCEDCEDVETCHERNKEMSSRVHETLYSLVRNFKFHSFFRT